MNPPGTPAAWPWLAALPFLLSILLNLAESAAVYLDDGELHRRKSAGERRAVTVAALLERHDRTELAVRIVSAGGLAISAPEAWRLAAPLGSLPAWGALAGWSLLYFSFGVVAPRRLAGYFPDVFAYSLAGLLRLACIAVSPLRCLIGALSGLPVRLAGRNPNEPPHSVTEEEIRMLVDEGEERGAIEESEKKMINSIFEFDDRDVSEVMTHRTEVAAVPVNATLREVAKVAIETGYSRIPVYEEDIDSICGIVYAKDLIAYIDRPGEFNLASRMRQPLYVPESSSCSDVFSLLQRKKTQLAVVVDEYGGTYGIVTMEDLLETIFGNIQDEYDRETPEAVTLGEGVYLLDGSMGISEAEQLLEIEIPEDSDADTLGGFVTELLGGVPKSIQPPPVVSFGGVTFTVVHADERRIDKIRAAVDPQQDREE